MKRASHCPEEIDGMIESAEENLAANPGYADLHNQLGLLYTLKENDEKAAAQFRQALMINPFYLEPRLNLAFLQMEQKKWEEAEMILKECIEIDPDNGISHHLLGAVHLVRRNQMMAVRSFEAAAEIDPFLRLQYETIGALQNQRIRLNGPVERGLVKSWQKLRIASLHHFMGQCYADIGEYRKAVREFRRAGRACPGDYRCPLNIGKLYDIQGDYQKAVAEFEKALQISPDCGATYAHMSYAFAGLGDLKKALASLQRAVARRPCYADLRYQLGLLYSDLGMYPEAVHELTQAVKINPKYLVARINLGVVHEKNGELEKALGEYERVAELVAQDEDLVNRIDQIKEQMAHPPYDLPNRLENARKP